MGMVGLRLGGPTQAAPCGSESRSHRSSSSRERAGPLRRAGRWRSRSMGMPAGRRSRSRRRGATLGPTR
eukprot:3462450-Pyramimonas_sp.AAC.1